MKHVLVMFAVMSVATTAYGNVAIELEFGPGTTGVVNPTGDSVTLYASDVAAIEVWAVDLSVGLGGWGLGVDVAAPLTEPPDFTYEGSVPGPIMYYLCAPTLNGNSFASGYVHPCAYGFSEALLFTMYIHCTGRNSQHQIFTNNFGGAAFVTSQWYPHDYPNVDFDDSVTIIQIPEPASLALLALGGMALTRRR